MRNIYQFSNLVLYKITKNIKTGNYSTNFAHLLVRICYDGEVIYREKERYNEKMGYHINYCTVFIDFYQH